MFLPPAASQSQGTRPGEPHRLHLHKKDSTQITIKALVTRTHSPKPVRCFNLNSLKMLQIAFYNMRRKLNLRLPVNNCSFLVEILQAERPQNDDNDGYNTCYTDMLMRRDLNWGFNLMKKSKKRHTKMKELLGREEEIQKEQIL